MSTQVLSLSEYERRFQCESPIERKMLEMLNDGPAVGTTAGLLPPMPWFEAIQLMRESDELGARHPLIIVPQAKFKDHRVDMLVLTRSRWNLLLDRRNIAISFIIECDGVEFHGVISGKIGSDVARESRLYKEAGLDILRFSGAEINFCKDEIFHIISARIEVMHALQNFGENIRSVAESVLAQINRSCCNPVFRPQYHQRNCPIKSEMCDIISPLRDEISYFNLPLELNSEINAVHLNDLKPIDEIIESMFQKYYPRVSP
jgi:hypothetical protein